MFSEAEVSALASNIDEINALFKTRGIKPADLPKPQKGLMYILISIGGAKVGALMAGSNGLIGAGIGRSAAQRWFREQPNENINNLMGVILANPEKAGEALAEVQTAAQLVTKLKYLAKPSTVIQLTEEDEDDGTR